MSYNNLDGIKLINGVPADLNAISKLIENDTFFKAEADTDENLSALDRDIIPVTDNTYSLGSPSNWFNVLWTENIGTYSLNTIGGTLAQPPVKIGTAALASLYAGQLSFISNSLEAIRLATYGVLVKTANNTQLTLENIAPGSEATWKLGGDSNDFGISSGAVKILSLTNDAVLPLKHVLLVDGTLANPALSFAGDSSMGLYRNGSKISFAIAGTSTLEMGADILKVLSGQILVPNGTIDLPAYSFQNAINTGLATNISQELLFSVEGKLSGLVGLNGISSISNQTALTKSKTYSDENGSFFVAQRTRGTDLAPTVVQDGDLIGGLSAEGLKQFTTGQEFFAEESGTIEFYSQDLFSNTVSGTYLNIKTTPKASNVPVSRVLIGKSDKPDFMNLGSQGLASSTVNGPATLLQVDVLNKSKLLINGTVEIKGFANGKEGQILHIVKLNNTGSFTLLHNNATAVQSVWLKGSSTFTISNDFGGIVLSFDNGQWREISRS